MTARPLLPAGIAMALFAVATNIPYLLLIDRFGYDDVLRQPPLAVLTAFQAGGVELILIWLAFGLCALSFVLVAGLIDRALRVSGAPIGGWILAVGVASAVAQAIGLARWVFVVPVLATTALDPSASPAAREAALAAYQAFHQFAGVAIGEHVGQLLLVAWTCGVSLAILRGGLGPRAFGWFGLALTPFWILGQSELLHTAAPAIPVLELTPYAFIGWELWLLALGCAWIIKGLRRSQAEP
ncbi:MAG: DUF4386 domain-containing protein [Phenylobacterium sp.]|uniref:DUF4386 domain-containing protein n=1 Tax=Phenylobacterium sp. TaxID=1871053 RepID=UPI002732AE66|nr:DUF4386 domain-containing protein [Phenylobacterium sp.]MDP3746134.1 DUF4386 domain-containing protein [Phenylobacterium sp.]